MALYIHHQLYMWILFHLETIKTLKNYIFGKFVYTNIISSPGVYSKLLAISNIIITMLQQTASKISFYLVKINILRHISVHLWRFVFLKIFLFLLEKIFNNIHY